MAHVEHHDAPGRREESDQIRAHALVHDHDAVARRVEPLELEAADLWPLFDAVTSSDASSRVVCSARGGLLLRPLGSDSLILDFSCDVH